MGNLKKELVKCKHPKSRKTKAFVKKVKRLNSLEKHRVSYATKANVKGEKLFWFQERIAEQEEPLSPADFLALFDQYFQRFEEELEQIELKQKVSKNRANQHVGRKNTIKMTLERERGEYTSGGIEMIDLCDKIAFNSLKNWDGSALTIQHLKLETITEKSLLASTQLTTSME